MHVVLVQPQIPQNTGSIARTCAAVETPLHIIGSIPFEISEKSVRRAGLDYWPFVNLSMHDSWGAFTAAVSPPKVWLFSTHGSRLYHEASFGIEDALVFGSETEGLGEEFLSRYPKESILRIPITCPGVRSLNLSNAVSIALYEARRQLGCDRS